MVRSYVTIFELAFIGELLTGCLEDTKPFHLPGLPLSLSEDQMQPPSH